MRCIQRGVSRLALYYAGNTPRALLALPSASRFATTRRFHFGRTPASEDGRKASHALGLVPSRTPDGGRLSSTSIPLSMKTARMIFSLSLSSFQLLFTSSFLSLSLIPDLFPFLPLEGVFPPLYIHMRARECSGYAARFISYLANWEAKTTAQDSRTKISAAAPPRRRECATRYRTRILPPPRRGRGAASLCHCARRDVPRRRRVFFQLRRDALRPLLAGAACSGLVN